MCGQVRVEEDWMNETNGKKEILLEKLDFNR